KDFSSMKIDSWQHIFGGCLTGMVDRVICEIDLVIVVLQTLESTGICSQDAP
ncbi:hypothetical protein CY34DRAFT_810039, partial [Suillus luteus UH-Slu-Lm8-n1]